MNLWGHLTTIMATMAIASSTVVAQDATVRYSDQEALAISQAAIGRPVADYDLTDSSGGKSNFGDLRGTPLVVSMIYTSCYHICPMLTQHVADVVDIAWEALGEGSFQVVTIGFDTAVDTPERMREYADARSLRQANWRFLSGDPETIEALSADLGFLFFSSPKGFDHLAQTTVLDADGTVYRQIYGQQFATPELVEPLKELVFGTPQAASLVEGWFDTVRLFCTIYDPTSGRYKFDYSIFVAIFVGVLCLGTAAIFIVRAWRDAI
jgi:protein SCO1/2